MAPPISVVNVKVDALAGPVEDEIGERVPRDRKAGYRGLIPSRKIRAKDMDTSSAPCMPPG